MVVIEGVHLASLLHPSGLKRERDDIIAAAWRICHVPIYLSIRGGIANYLGGDGFLSWLVEVAMSS